MMIYRFWDRCFSGNVHDNMDAVNALKDLGFICHMTEYSNPEKFEVVVDSYITTGDGHVLVWNTSSHRDADTLCNMQTAFYRKALSQLETWPTYKELIK